MHADVTNLLVGMGPGGIVALLLLWGSVVALAMLEAVRSETSIARALHG